MRHRKLPLIILTLLLFLIGGGYFLLPTLTVVTDPVYRLTDLDLALPALERKMLKQGVRVKVEKWDTLPESREEAVTLLNKTHGKWTLSSPLVTTLMAEYRIQETEIPTSVYIGMETESELATFTLTTTQESGFPQKGDDQTLLVSQGQAPSQINVYPHHMELTEVTDTSAIASLRAWEAAGYRTIVWGANEDPSPFFSVQTSLQWIVPGRFMLAVPKENLQGVVVDDLAATLSEVIYTQPVSPQTVPLLRRYVPLQGTHGGWFGRLLQAIRRWFS